MSAAADLPLAFTSDPFTPAGLTPARLAEVLDRPISDEQAAVVTAPLEAGVVVAGAGSGKTATMVARVVWLVGTGQVPADQVLGLTFTTKAADELATRVRSALRRLRAAGLQPPATGPATGPTVGPTVGPTDLEPTISTYHSYAARLVRDHALRLGREPGARLITPATSWQLAARAVSYYDGPMGAVTWAESTVIQAVLALAGDLAEHLVDADAVREVGVHLQVMADGAAILQAPAHKVLACQRTRGQLLPIVERYAALKRERELLDFGDVVALAAELARDCPQVRELERAACRVVLLDEYQDTGAAQEVLLSNLFGDGHPVTAVGDPCQSIYGWRGASAGTLRRFTAAFGAPSARPRNLTTTYRSGGRLLGLANAVSEELRAEGVPVPRLRPAPGCEDDGRVRSALLPDVDTEAAWVADGIVAGLASLPAVDAGYWSRAAVLCRKRSMFPRLRAAFEARHVPVEVVGLGGLLTVPEVADVRATLQVLDDPTADAALLRLLTGPRWRLGPRDLAALGRRTRQLARGTAPPPGDPVDAVVLGVDEAQVGSLVDALDDLPPPGAHDPLSAEGRRRLEALRDELRALRRRADQPLPDLVGDVERTLGLDVEVSARVGAVDPAAARADLDAFADAAAQFAGDTAQDGTGGAVLSAFLAHLSAAEDEEHGLDTGAVSGADTVKLMTVHAAKGLEWPVVAVPGLARSTSGGAAVFPAKSATSTSWIGNARLLPFPLRGDRSELPDLRGLEKDELAEHLEANAVRDAREERRLAYVAFTRAEQLLLCSGYHWGDGSSLVGPSVFLDEARTACLDGAGDVDVWTDHPPQTNPVVGAGRTAAWPSAQPPAAPEVQAAAARVRALLAAPVAAPHQPAWSPPDGSQTPENRTSHSAPADLLDVDGLALTTEARALVQRWDDDLRRLAEEARRRTARRTTAVLPPAMSVTGLVALRRDPEQLARSLLRPLPRKPSPVTRRGTAFHAWLETTVFGQPQLLDPDELPGAADEGADDDDLRALQQAFRDSVWWGRAPAEIEVPFEMAVEGVLVRGRMDAVFTAGDGGWDVVDWKTGRKPSGADATAAAVQLAAYRLAWHQLTGAPLERVSAAFFYVRSNETVRPADLLDADGLRALVAGVAVDEQA